MRNMYSPAILASYVTFKELYNEGKYRSPYQILGEFIKYIVATEHKYSFSLFDMKNYLEMVFGFELPTAVIKTAVKGIEGIDKEENSVDYVVDEKKISENTGFNEFRKEAEEDNIKLSELLLEFAHKQDSEQYIEKDALFQNFIAYLIDEHSDTKHHDLISKFILAYAEDQDVKQSIESIRQGSILYTGLNYNISEIGSLKKNLVLYLDTEILFDLAGYNGEIYHSIAEDFIKLVRDANCGESKIKLYYFKDVHDEVIRFFCTAEAIVEGKQLLLNKSAMKAICNGCKSRADVIEKQADLFHKLKIQYGVNEDPTSTYYSQGLIQYNLEGMKFDAIPDDEETHDSLRYISHINKLRKGRRFQECTESEFLFVTETRRTLDISKNVVDEFSSEANSDSIQMCGFAQNMSGITNVLWYKLNKGFGRKDYPQNLDAVLKAKIVIAKHVSQKVAMAYRELKQKYDNGEITKEKMATRMIALRKKNERPEDIRLENAEEDLDFSPEYYQKYEIAIEKNKTLLKDKEEFIKELQEKALFDRRKSDDIIAQLHGTIEEQKTTQSDLMEKINNQQNEIESQKQMILELQNKERNHQKKICLIKNYTKLIVKNILYVFIVLFVAFGTNYVCKCKGWSFGTVISILIGLAGLVPIAINIVKHDYNELIASVKNNKE